MKLAACVLLAALGPLVLVGCGETKVCTLELRLFTVAMTRPVAVDGALETLTVEACVAERCVTGTSDAHGAVSFAESYGDDATDGTIDRTAQTVSVRFNISEKDEPTELVVRVKRGAELLSEAKGTVQWRGDDCHTAPVSTTI